MRAIIAIGAGALAIGSGSHVMAQSSERERTVARAMVDIWGGNANRSPVQVPKASGFSDTDDAGVRRTDAQVSAFDAQLPAVRQTEPSFITLSDQKIDLYGDAAVVTFRGHDCVGAPGREPCYHFAGIDTLIYRQGGWVRAASQQTAIAANAPDMAEISQRNVLQAQEQIDTAQLSSDVAAFERLTTDDYRFTLPNGKVVERRKFVEDMRTIWKPTKISRSDVKVKLMRASAIVTGLATFEWVNRNGARQTATERFTDVYARSFRNWRKVSGHSSCMSGSCA